MFKGSIISRLAVLTLAACAVAVGHATYAAERAGNVWQRTTAWFVDRFDWLVSKIKQAPAQHLDAPRRELLGAVQLQGRLMRRQRPIVCPRWRMCPSA